MSHSSGIELSEELVNKFKEMNQNGQGRYIKAEIEEDKIVIKKVEEGSDSFDNDLDLVLNDLVDACPSYFIFRTEQKDTMTNGYKWILF